MRVSLLPNIDYERGVCNIVGCESLGFKWERA